MDAPFPHKLFAFIAPPWNTETDQGSGQQKMVAVPLRIIFIH
jgi:hypothetical protein